MPGFPACQDSRETWSFLPGTAPPLCSYPSSRSPSFISPSRKPALTTPHPPPQMGHQPLCQPQQTPPWSPLAYYEPGAAHFCILPMILYQWEEPFFFLFLGGNTESEKHGRAPQGKDLNFSPSGLVPKVSMPNCLLACTNGHS